VHILIKSFCEYHVVGALVPRVELFVPVLAWPWCGLLVPLLREPVLLRTEEALRLCLGKSFLVEGADLLVIARAKEGLTLLYSLLDEPILMDAHVESGTNPSFGFQICKQWTSS